MFTDTITLYNSYYDKTEEEDIYYSTVIENVEVQKNQGANITNSGITSSDAVKVFIDVINLPKAYLRPKEWASQADKTQSFTLKPNENDFFIVGNIVDSTKDYEQMRRQYDDVYKITTVDVYDEVLPHFEVGGV